MGSPAKPIQFLILSILISAALCYTNHGPIASGSVLESAPDDGGGARPASKFVYTIEDPETKIPCTLANMSISIVVNYTTKQKTVVRKYIEVPNDAVVKGTCRPMVSELSFIWKTWMEYEYQENVVKFVMFNDRTNFSVFSVDVDLVLDPTRFPNAAAIRRTTRSDVDLGLFGASVEDGLHKCPKERRIKIDDDLDLIAWDVSFIAFNTNKDYGQRKETICKDDANTKVFPFHIKEKYDGVALLAKMSFNIEIPYPTINDTIAKYTVNLPARNATVIGVIFKDFTDDTWGGYIFISPLFISPPNLLATYDIKINFNQDIDGIAYISSVELIVIIPEKYLPDAKYPIITTVTKRFALFPVPSDSGIFSCPRGVTLYMDDIRLQMTDILLVMFDRTRDFSSKQVIDCNTQPKLTKKNFTYVVQEKNGPVPCILANMSISMSIPYRTKSVEKTEYANITVPANATVSGFCDPSLSKMELTWPAEDRQLNSAAFYLSRDSNFSMFHMETNIYMDNTSFPDIADLDVHQWDVTRSNFSLDMFVSPNDNGWYNCPKREEIIRSDWDTVITIRNVSLIAFNDQEDLNVKKAYACPDHEERNDIIQPHPSEAAFKYVVRDQEKNVACILANMIIGVKVTYKTKWSSESETTIVMPSDGVNVTGNCNYINPELTLSWLQTGVTPSYLHPDKTRNSISLKFSGDDLYFYVTTVQAKLFLDEINFPNAELERQYTVTEKNQNLFTSFIHSIYVCDWETVVELTKHDKINVQLTFYNISLTAFNSYRNVSQLWASHCYISHSDSNIGIILGSIAGGLLVGFGISGIIYVCAKHYRKR